MFYEMRLLKIKFLTKILFPETIICPEFVNNFSSEIPYFQAISTMRHSAFIFLVIFRRVLLDIRRNIASRFVDFSSIVLAILIRQFRMRVHARFIRTCCRDPLMYSLLHKRRTRIFSREKQPCAELAR